MVRVECRPCRVPSGTTRASAHPVVVDPAVTGWDGFDPLIMTGHGEQTFTETVEQGRLRVTGPVEGFGNHRVAYPHRAASWTNSEVRSLIWGPSPDFQGVNAQQGHLHRVRQLDETQWEGIAVWTAVFGGDYGVLNCRAVRFNGETLLQSSGDPATGGGTARDLIDRRMPVWGADRFEFAQRLSRLNLAGDMALAQHWAEGDLIEVDGVPEFNETAPLASKGTGLIHLATGEADTVPWGLVGPPGHVTPVSGQKRWVPYLLATRVSGGTEDELVVEWKRCRPETVEPDWGHPSVQKRTVLANEAVPSLPVGPGMCGLWGAHFFSGSFGEWGPVEMREVGMR